MRDMHWDKRKDKPSWKRVAGSVAIALALLGILMYFSGTIYSLFGGEISPTSLHMLDMLHDNSWKVFGAGGAIYVGGEIASSFMKNDDFSGEAGTEDFTEQHSMKQELAKEE